jgi:hypothetical protein
MVILPEAICKFIVASIKILLTFFTKREKNAKIHMETQKTLNNQSKPKQKEQCWSYHNT